MTRALVFVCVVCGLSISCRADVTIDLPAPPASATTTGPATTAPDAGAGGSLALARYAYARDAPSDAYGYGYGFNRHAFRRGWRSPWGPFCDYYPGWVWNGWGGFSWWNAGFVFCD